MKQLKKLLLINWHYFGKEEIEFGQLNFLTGKNASGKSTIIDALQLVLLADTGGSFFNKAAQTRSGRTLRGYLLGEIGDDGEGGFRYLRPGRFTSYIALEFFDEERNKSFTAGCAFDVYSENDIQRLFFLYDGPLHEEGFVRSKVPMDIPALRAYLKEHFAGHYDTTDVGRDFRGKLYGKLGGLRERFGSLLKKGVSFNPDVDIQQFISDFVCDSQEKIDVSLMQENLRSYKRLEDEALSLKGRIALLEEIVEHYGTFETQRANEKLYDYLILRARLEEKRREIAGAQGQRQAALEGISQGIGSKEAAETRKQSLQTERDLVSAQLQHNESHLVLQELKRGIQELEEAIGRIKKEAARTKEVLTGSALSWRSVLTDLDGDAPVDEALPLPLQELLADLSKITQRLARDLEDLPQHLEPEGTEGTEAALTRRKDLMEEVLTQKDRILLRLEDHLHTVQSRLGELKTEEQALSSGIFPLPKDALRLKEELIRGLTGPSGTTPDVRILSERAEIKSERWRNVIEGYLHTQKYYILVEPESFQAAVRIFDRIKRSTPLFGTGLVDIEKIQRLAPQAQKGSLAEEIETKDEAVRLFLTYALGRVLKCDDVEKLREFKTSVTDEGMLYQNYVVRAMNPERWSKPAIGRSAIEKSLDRAREAILRLTAQARALTALQERVSRLKAVRPWHEVEIQQLSSALTESLRLTDLTRQLDELRKNLAAVDTRELDHLRSTIRQLDEDLTACSAQISQADRHIGTQSQVESQLANETIPRLEKEGEDLASELGFRFEDSWVEAKGAVRYDKELFARKEPLAIADAFPREKSKAANARALAWENLVEGRRIYNERYKMGYDIKAPGNEPYDDAYLELSEIKLPEYEARIQDARQKAFEQFREDFLSRLQSNINSARRQIDELNFALRGATFGEDSFRFRVIPRPEYKRYYDMIVDDMLLEGGYNLLSGQFNVKYKEEIDDLFGLISQEDKGGFEYEKKVQEYTDFRTYLSFDLESVGKDGMAQRLSRTMGKKSGGETQTPFYLAVLASFAQLYRFGRDGKGKQQGTSRLIIFDEAFSKMDGERIVKSIELLRKFNFQVILSAPPDKIGDIAALVDKNLCVLREGRNSVVRSFEPRHFLEEGGVSHGPSDAE